MRAVAAPVCVVLSEERSEKSPSDVFSAAWFLVLAHQRLRLLEDLQIVIYSSRMVCVYVRVRVSGPSLYLSSLVA